MPYGIRMGAGWSSSSTRIRWSNTPNGDLERDSVFVTSEKRFGDKTAIQIGAGATVGGSLESGGLRYRLGPGWAGFGSVSVRAVDGEDLMPLVLVTGSISFSSARTAVLPLENDSATLTAVDFRAGVVVGKTLYDRLTPFIVLRGFGGPVAWSVRGSSQSGTDVYHYQVGGGLVAQLPPFDLYAEWSFFGEQAVTAGAGVSF